MIDYMMNGRNFTRLRPDGKTELVVDAPRAPFSVIMDKDDAEESLGMELVLMYRRDGTPRVNIKSGPKYISLARWVLEAAKPRPDMDKMFARHSNGDTLDMRRDNLKWSLSKSGKVSARPVDKGGRFTLTHHGRKAYFLTEEECDRAKTELKNGAEFEALEQSGRRAMNRWPSAPGGRSMAPWSMWLRARKTESADMLAGVQGSRERHGPWEDDILIARARAASVTLGTDSAVKYAAVLAEWMDRMTQAAEPVDEETLSDKRVERALMALTFRDPFEGPECIAPLVGTMPETLALSDLRGREEQ